MQKILITGAAGFIGYHLSKSLLEDGIIVFGSESNGISREIKKEINDYISIPKTASNSTAESLNLSISVAIFLSKIKGI